MDTRVATLALLVLHLAPGAVLAGGSGERVHVTRFSQSSDTAYELVVVPSADSLDPYMKGCSTFTVRGDLKRLAGSLWPWPSRTAREKHLHALAALKAASASPTPITLGWMGGGFKRIRPADPCTVESRSLEVIEESGQRAIVSYHDAV